MMANPGRTRRQKKGASPLLAFQVERGKLRLLAKPAPKLRPRWTLVRVRMAGICNTDV